MWPKLSNIEEDIFKKIVSTPPLEYSSLNCFARIISGVNVKYPKFNKETKKQVEPGKGGLIMVSNPDWQLFQAAGNTGASVYGTTERSGTIGMDWYGNAVNTSESSEIDVPFKPSPIITAINAKEGKDQISRHLDLKITAFTLAQVDLIQKYLMEPGYSLLVEWGWNTPDGVSGLVPIYPTTKLVELIGNRNLDNDTLHATRKATKGDYDSFFGFIVGGNVNTNNDTFDISIKLRGAPGLPTYLQSHANVSTISDDNTITNSDAVPPFGITSLLITEETGKAERRFKQMFNLLPKTRQTQQVVNLMSVPNEGWNEYDLINFDPVLDAEISIFRDGRPSETVEGEAPEEQDPKELENKQSGQTNLNQENDAKGKGRKDAPYVQWQRYNNIANKINELMSRNGTNGFFDAWLESNQGWKDWNAGLGAAAVKPEELQEVFKTRFSKTDFQNPDIGTKYGVKPAEQWPVPPPLPAEPAPEGATGTVAQTGGFTVGASQVTATDIQLAGELPIPKEKFFSKNRYIRFAKAIQVLNANNELTQYYVAKKPINVVVNIKDAYIGAFEGIYSYKPESLLIPGRMPDFSKFFMQANLVELSENSAFIDNSIGPIQFAQPEPLDSNGLKEDKYKWGKLENLYINFDLFKKELEKPNRTMREVLESLLNEMSLAANSLWNFQVVEKSATVKIGEQDVKTTVYTIIDENWIGKNVSGKPREFIHSGANSRFLSADLTIDLGGSITQQVIAKRLSLSTNPDQPQVAIGGVFTNSVDVFLPTYVGPAYKNGNSNAGQNGDTGQSGLGEKKEGKFDAQFAALDENTLTPEQKQQQIDLNQRAEGLVKDEEALKTQTDYIASRKAELQQLKSDLDKVDGNESIFFNDEQLNVAEKTRIEAEIKRVQAIIELQQKDYENKTQVLKDAQVTLDNDVNAYLDGAKKQVATNVTNNMELIDVVQNPVANSITQDDLNGYLNNITLFNEKFKIYCCRDQKFLNVLKNNNLKVNVSGGDRLSHPLPIKYSFTILGKSGIRRGDTFTVKGIPEKYSKFGFFQVTEVEHSISDMKWTTRVLGEYRQIQ